VGSKNRIEENGNQTVSWPGIVAPDAQNLWCVWVNPCLRSLEGVGRHEDQA
jgi:hypothetical protein